ncbi:MAG: hypothetical protein ACXACF_01645 [Candidatus Hermodarchaeia archaeon]|jgi:hypothetical protein
MTTFMLRYRNEVGGLNHYYTDNRTQAYLKAKKIAITDKTSVELWASRKENHFRLISVIE